MTARSRETVGPWGKWEIGICEAGGGFEERPRLSAAERKVLGCQPTYQDRMRDVPRDGPEAGTPHLQYRGFCRGCGWSGPERWDGNEAIEDAHDHAFPGWRTLPVLEEKAYSTSWVYQAGPQRERRRQEELAQIRPFYPPDYERRQGPVRSYRTPPGTRHVHGYSPFGGYELAVVKEHEPGLPSHPEQLGLFDG